MQFQVQMVSNGNTFAATAIGHRHFGEQLVELQVVLRGHVDGSGKVCLAPTPEEDWRAP